MLLKALAEKRGLEVVIIRPPLVVERDAPGNLRRLLTVVDKQLPLPLATVRNRRSFVALDNLVALVRVCLEHSAAKNQTFLVSDLEDISTTGMLRRIGRAMGRPPRLIPFPGSLLRWTATMLGKGELAQRLVGRSRWK